MAISYLGAGIYKGLQADLSTLTTAASNAIFVTTDSRRTYHYSGGIWTPTSFEGSNSTYTIYIAGTNVKAMNNRTGLVDFTNVGGFDNTTDASKTIQAAINNIQNISGFGIDTMQGASLFLQAGKYKCASEILMTLETGTGKAGRNAIGLIGEGNGTYLSFEPSSALTNGIRMKGNFNRLEHLLIDLNSNVVNGVHGEGPVAPPGGQYNWGMLNDVTICGPDSNIPNGAAATITSSGAVVSGQTGLYLQGDHLNPGTSYSINNWRISNCQFFALDVGIKLIGQTMDMSNWNNIHIGACEIGMIIEGVQHNLSNFRIEGGGGTVSEGVAPVQGAATIGSRGIWIKPPNVSDDAGGNITFLSNINIELHKPNSIGILIDRTSAPGITPPASGGSLTHMSNVYDSSADGMTRLTILDNNTVPGVNFTDSNISGTNRTSQSKKRYGSINFGFNRRGFENGILNGNVKTLIATTTTTSTADVDLPITAFINGPFATLQTTNAVNNVACIYYNNSLANRIIKSQNPNFYCRFIPNSTANIRVFMGLWTIPNATPSTDPNPFSAPTGGGNPLNGRRGVGLYLDVSNDNPPGTANHWKLTYNDGGATAPIDVFPTKTFGNATYGPNAVSSGAVQAVTISYTDSNGSNPDVASGPTASVLHYGKAYDWKSTNVPTADNFGFLIYLENLTAGAQRTLRLFDMEMGVTVI